MVENNAYIYNHNKDSNLRVIYLSMFVFTTCHRQIFIYFGESRPCKHKQVYVCGQAGCGLSAMSKTVEVLSVRMTWKCKTLSVQRTFYQSNNITKANSLKILSVVRTVNTKLFSTLHVFYPDWRTDTRFQHDWIVLGGTSLGSRLKQFPPFFPSFRNINALVASWLLRSHVTVATPTKYQYDPNDLF